jgi:hypothetical protein
MIQISETRRMGWRRMNRNPSIVPRLPRWVSVDAACVGFLMSTSSRVEIRKETAAPK